MSLDVARFQWMSVDVSGEVGVALHSVDFPTFDKVCVMFLASPTGLSDLFRSAFSSCAVLMFMMPFHCIA